MTPKENYLMALQHKKPLWVPNQFTDVCICGFGAMPGPWIEKGPLGGGYDGFGVRWVTPSSGGGAPIPAPGEFVLKDITEWESKVRFPDLDAFDWAADVAECLKNCDRSQTLVDFGSGNGVFERVAALMGFEEALIAMHEEPEACIALMSAITDYKIKIAEKVKQYYNPDTFTNYDDIATEHYLFMSPETYRKIIKPQHARLYQAVADLGMIPVQHTCGKAEELIEDFIETGAQAWISVQPTNDIEGLLTKYGDKIALIGGYDTNGPSGRTTDPEVIRAEVRRCIDTYGSHGSYIFFGFMLVNSLDPNDNMALMGPMIMEAAQYAHQVAGA